MFDIPTPIILVIASLLAIVLYLFFWRAVRELALPMKIAARVLLTVVLFLPIALVTWSNYHARYQGEAMAPPPEVSMEQSKDMSSLDKSEDRDDGVSEPTATPTRGLGSLKRKKVMARRKVAAKPAPPSPLPSAPSAPSGGLAGGMPDVSAPAEPPTSDMDGTLVTPGSTSAPEATGGGAGEGADDAVTGFSEKEAAPIPPVSEKPKTNWTVVPVYYGTDRKHKPGTKRLDYSWERARRMELGRALVTIPKAHVVPMVERPWAIRIPYVDITLYEAAEDPQKHFTIKEIKSLSREEFLKAVRKKISKASRFKDQALIFIHGYKNHFDNAVFRTAQIAYDLKYDSAPFLYSWPSGGTLQGYTYDRESAEQAEPYLRSFLDLVVNETGAKKVSIIAHSMGNQLLLRVLQDLKRSKPDEVVISQLILAAPDVDRDAFENIVKSIKGIAQGVTLYTAANDAALRISRRVNGGVARAGDVPEDGPIVIEGVDTIDATATSMDSIGINHSGYAENNALLNDIGLLIKTGQRPPGMRVPTLERVNSPKGVYWRYPSTASPQ